MPVQSTRADQRIMCLRGNSHRESRANHSPRYIGWPVIIRNNKLTADRPFSVGITLLDTRWRFSLATANTNSTRALDRLFQLALLNLSDRTAVQAYALFLSFFFSRFFLLFSTRTNNISCNRGDHRIASGIQRSMGNAGLRENDRWKSENVKCFR